MENHKFKILIIASYNKGYFAPFIIEQANSIASIGHKIEYFGITGKGFLGYLKSIPSLLKIINNFKPDIIHAHYGLSGLLACLQRRVPVVTTFHGSDINEASVLKFSKIAIRLSAFSIFVSQKNVDIARPKKNYELIPCGIDLTDLQLTDKVTAIKKTGLNPNHKHVLFSGSFSNSVKNYPLAKATMELVQEADLIELKGYTREQVTLLMCACDAILMTSFTEGSPQVIKEAMACGCPVVSVDVGDVKELSERVDGCYITNREPDDIAAAIKEAISFGKTRGRDRIISRNLDNNTIAHKLVEIYKSLAR